MEQCVFVDGITSSDVNHDCIVTHGVKRAGTQDVIGCFGDGNFAALAESLEYSMRSEGVPK